MTAGDASESTCSRGDEVRHEEGVEQCPKEMNHMSSHQAPQDEQEDMPVFTDNEKRSPQYISCCEDDEEQDGAREDCLSRGSSPIRFVSNADEHAPAKVPALPNPLRNAGLRVTHVRALRLEAELQPMRLILSRLMAHQTHNRKGLFNAPVNPVALGLTDYHDVITKPMDLGTVKAKLHSVNYKSRQEAAEDIRLVCNNAMKYNPSPHMVHVAARNLLAFFEELYAALGPPPAEQPNSNNAAVPATLATEPSRRVSFAAVPIQSPGLFSETPASPVITRTVSFPEADFMEVSSNEGGSDGQSTEPFQSPPTLPSQQFPENAPQRDLMALTPQGTRTKASDLAPSIGADDAPKKRRLSYAGSKNNKGHSCQFCLARSCALCEQGCLPLEATLLVCRGSGCNGAKIRKGATFYVAPDGTRQYCQRCFPGLPPVLSQASQSEPARYKRDLLKRKNDEELAEPWLTCSGCQSAVHQMCAMHNSFVHDEDTYLCPGCVSTQDDSNVNTHDSSLSGVFTFVTGSDTPVPMSDVTDSSFCLGKDMLSADMLAETDVSAFIQKKVRTRIAETSGVPDAEKTVVVRIISDCERHFQVPDVVRKHFRMPNADDDSQVSSSSVVPPPTKVKYNSKAIALFQKVDGLDVCIFCMYVHEYDGEDEYEEGKVSPSSSKKRVYIAYLDSVEHFRPRSCRTSVYHELLVAYLASARLRGYESAHIWACPPSRGNSFVFWNHPSSQRTPTRDRLISWYHGALSRAIDCGVVTDVKSLYESEFHENLQDIEKESSGGDSSKIPVAGKLPCPPIFEGDYWIEEAVRIHGTSLARHMRTKSSSELDLSKLSSSLLDGWEPCPARQISALLVDCVMAHPSAAPFRQPVNAAALKLKDYHKIVTQPMDLGTINAKCIHGEYHSLGELVAEVQLTFANAKRFNPVGHFVHNMAIDLEGFFFEQLGVLTSQWRDGSERPKESWQRFSDISLSLDKELENPGASESASDSYGCVSEGRASPAAITSWPALAPSNLDDSDGADKQVDSKDLQESGNVTNMECGDATLCPNVELPPVEDNSKRNPPLSSACHDLLTGGPEAVSNRMIGEDKHLQDKKTPSSTPKRPAPSKKSGGKRRRSSKATAVVMTAEDTNSVKRRRQTWLGEEVGASVRSMRTSFFACSLVPKKSLSEKEQDKLDHFSSYSSVVSELSSGPSQVISSSIADARHGLLEFSQFRNFEFDTLRHAKYSTAMLLYHLHHPDAPGMIPRCTTCHKETVERRWHKVVRLVDPNRAAPRKNTRFLQSEIEKPEELCSDCHASHPNRDQFIPHHVSFQSF